MTVQMFVIKYQKATMRICGASIMGVNSSLEIAFGSSYYYSSNSGKLELETAAMWLKVFSDFGLGRLFVI